MTGSLERVDGPVVDRLGSGSAPYVATQGRVLGRASVTVSIDSDGQVWIGGDVVTCVPRHRRPLIRSLGNGQGTV